MRLDFTGDAIAKADVGLSDSAIAPDVVAPKDTKLALPVKGSHGILSAQTDHVRFTTTGSMPDIYIMYCFLTATNLPDFADLVRDGVAAYGMNSEAAERWLDTTEADPDPKSDYAIGSGSTNSHPGQHEPESPVEPHRLHDFPRDPPSATAAPGTVSGWMRPPASWTWQPMARTRCGSTSRTTTIRSGP